MSLLEDPRYDANDRMAVIAGRRIQLTEREGDAFGYLCERVGQVVGRKELEREVWGFAPGIRSETVPVTMRTLRRKLSEDDDDLLQTVRGVGWRLNPVRVAAPSTLPHFETPWFPRADEEQALRRLVDAGWRVVTLVGPGGSGKSRLACATAGALPGRVVWVAVPPDATAEQLGAAILGAAGVNGRDPGDLTLAIDAELLFVVLDEAEVAWSAVREVVQQLREVRFLITSRRELGLAGEAVHAIAPMAGDEGARFLQSRIQASRWARNHGTDLLERAVELLDGLPLGLELAAAHPDPLDALVDVFERGELPRGPEAERMEGTLRSSVDRLDAPERELLTALSLCEGPLEDADLEDWLGSDALPRVRELASRSLVDHQRAGWVLLRTMRTFVRHLDADWPVLEASFRDFLYDRLLRWGRDLYRDPARATARIGALQSDLYHVLEGVPAERVPEAASILQLYYETHGPRMGAARLLELCQRRLGTHPLPALLDIVQNGPSAGPLPRISDESDVDTRIWGRMVQSDYARDQLDLDELDALLAAVPPDDLRRVHRVECLRVMTINRTDPERAHQLLEDLLARVADVPGLHADTLHRMALASRRDPHRAIPYARQAVQEARRTGLPILEFRCRWALSSLLVEIDPPLGAEAFLEAAEFVRHAAPREADALESAAGLTVFGLGEHDRAIPLLEVGSRYPASHIHGPCQAALAVIRLRRGEHSARSTLERVDPRTVLLFRADGSSAGEAFCRVLKAELLIDDARRTGNLAQVRDELLARVRADAHPDDPRLMLLARERLLERLEALQA